MSSAKLIGITRHASNLSAALMIAAAALPASAFARGDGGSCNSPMVYTEISRIKADYFGTPTSPWLNAFAEWQGLPTRCLNVSYPGQKSGYNAGCSFFAAAFFEKDGTVLDVVVAGLESGVTQPSSTTLTEITGGCEVRFSVDVVFRSFSQSFSDGSWVFLIDDAPLVKGQRLSVGTHYIEWRLNGRADLDQLCPAPCQLNLLNMPTLVFTRYVAPPCVGDIDGDGSVGAADLSTLLSLWGDPTTGAADLDGDGVAGASDLSLLLSNWGTCPQ